MILLLLVLLDDVPFWTGDKPPVDRTLFARYETADALKKHFPASPEIDLAKNDVLAIVRAMRANAKLTDVFLRESDACVRIEVEWRSLDKQPETVTSWTLLSVPKTKKRIELHVRYYAWGFG